MIHSDFVIASFDAVLIFSASIGVLLGLYIVLGLVGFFSYSPNHGEERAENVRFVITTVASEAVRPALTEAIDHQLENFGEYELFVLIDEGADLESELLADERFRTVVVPETFDCEAKAKGRAMQYFVETVVADEPGWWYAFLDDDNLLLDDSLLYEIPVYERQGYGAANPVLVPRPGRSMATFVMDHLRTLDDLTVFRTFTGLLGKPAVGFHGELLTVKGDVLVDIGFDRESIVEDYAFAARLIEQGIPVWQTASRVSILSPHTMEALFKQRRRWYLGLWREQFRNPPIAVVAMGLRMLAWTFALLGGVAFLPVWVFSSTGISVPVTLHGVALLGAVIYWVGYLYGVSRTGSAWPKHLLLVPVYSVLEATTAVYSVYRWTDSFVVIEK
jgi:cellulose synthase/poly-beta-1,6-N-acetylglucosamine synthase-like glycosyltransferase